MSPRAPKAPKEPQPPKPKRPPRIVLTVRVGEAGIAALDRIAAVRKTTRSEIHRLALADYCARHDPERQRR